MRPPSRLGPAGVESSSGSGAAGAAGAAGAGGGVTVVDPPPEELESSVEVSVEDSSVVVVSVVVVGGVVTPSVLGPAGVESSTTGRLSVFGPDGSSSGG